MTMMMSRRDLITRTAALAAATPALGWGRRPAPALHDVLERCAQEMLEDYPQQATALGLDSGARASLRYQLDDRSAEGMAGQQRRCAERLALLRSVERQSLDNEALLTLDATLHAHALAAKGARFDTGHRVLQATMSQTWSPYAITQMTGAFSEDTDHLVNEHPVTTRADIDAYIERLGAFAMALDGETERLQADHARGATPPAFMLELIVRQQDAALKPPAAESELVQSLARRARAAELDANDAARRAARVVERQWRPALRRQRDAAKALIAQAPAEGGVSRLPGGEASYAWFLEVSTCGTSTAGEIHRLGLALTRDLGARIDAGLRAAGLTQGSIAQRLLALTRDPAHRFPSTEAGRAQLIAHANALLARARERIGTLSKLTMKAPVTILRVPPDIEAGAAGAYMVAGSQDGSRPSRYYLNLRDTADWPRWALPTLTYHETLPGHAWQEAYGIEHTPWPLVRSLIRFNASSEGWALYAEQLADEQGWYADDPLGRLGYLQAMQMRAARLVVDTGLHAFGWTHQQAVHYMVESTGRTPASMHGEIDRYCAKPGQACGYMTGLHELLALRDEARKAPGFDVRDFNDFVLRSGNVPFQAMRAFWERARRATAT
ncbi:DUF885 domain-containing protein [Ideonella sp. BN130291]|uniref:DUF885 domain-containing protein n=1 Tax=Ideonella sp. BN130291 TaxID=3112940 RepID=UPI002E275E80|nr:DUF885 family protein [Ideonella sp. BN130291]